MTELQRWNHIIHQKQPKEAKISETNYQKCHCLAYILLILVNSSGAKI